MPCTGIIAEYNPFHNGHAYHLQQAISASGNRNTIIVMSGNYVQRGEPALLDKWTRTRMALAGGASIVIELPTLYASASSEYFAEAGVRLLMHTGLCSHISFGAEQTDLSMLMRCAKVLAEEPEAYRASLSSHLAEGLGFAAARALALEEQADVDPKFLDQPNAILALEYCKAILKLGASLTPVPVLRETDYHASHHERFPSAATLRQMLRDGISIAPYVPETTSSLLAEASLADPFDGWSDLLYDRLLHHDKVSLSAIRDVGEGLESRILSVCDHPLPLSKAIEKISTKRYPKARIRRILLSVLLDIRQEMMSRDPGYLRILGFRNDAEPLLAALTRSADVPVITNPARQLSSLSEPVRHAIEREAYYTDLYFAHMKKSTARRGAEMTMPIIKYHG